MDNKNLPQEEYKYGFHDEDVSVYNTGKGLSEEIVRLISAKKQEPEWMLELRLKAYRQFVKMDTPQWGPDIKNIDFNDNYASVLVQESAIATSKEHLGDFTAIGELYSTSKCIYYLEKQGQKWLISSEKILEETSSLKYGDARYINMELFAPNQTGAGKTYTAALKVDSPKDTVVVASINKENIVYPQVKTDEAFRKMPDDNILERYFTSNTLNVNEYAVASVGITRAENYSADKIRVYMGGLAFIMTRVNVVPENKYVKFEENESTKGEDNGKSK